MGEQHPDPRPSFRMGPAHLSEDRQDCCAPSELPPITHTSCTLTSTAENLVPRRPQRLWRPFGGGVTL